jgi:hypothetical protein
MQGRLLRFCTGAALLTLGMVSFAATSFAAVSLAPADIDWTTVNGSTVHFHLRFRNTSPTPSQSVAGTLKSQMYGAFAPDLGTIGTFNVPPMQPNSFFDVFFDVPLSSLPPSAEERHPPGGFAATVSPETNPPCPPDDHWDGNVDVNWAGPGGQGQVNRHFGTIQVCPGAGNSYIHVITFCGNPMGWNLNVPCPAGWTVKLVNQDFSPAPAVVPPNWTGWLCISAAPTVAINSQCCPILTFTCNNQPGVIELCATACSCTPKAPQPTIGSIDWTTTPNNTVKFAVRWQNPDANLSSDPVNGQMASQKYGVFLPDFGSIGTFSVPPIAPSSFFDVFIEVPLSSLPPSAQTQRPGGTLLLANAPETNPRCPPSDHWNGNVDITWSSQKQPGNVQYHKGDLMVCPGADCSYIHVVTNCTVAPGATWTVKGPCPGWSATLVNEDKSAAPNPIPPGWTGWICVKADASVPIGASCCIKINFNCGGSPAEIVVCGTTCDCSPKPSQPVPGTIDWTNVPGTNNVRFHVRWNNPDQNTSTDPAQGQMFSQPFGVFLDNFGPIGSFNVPPIPPSSFFDVFVEIPLSQLPPTAEERLSGSSLMASGPDAMRASIGPETHPGCPPDFHWDGNVDIQWQTPKMPGEVHYHNGTLQICPGSGPSYIHIFTNCNDPTGVGATWGVKGLCSGFSATLVNQDFSPAPNPIPPNWMGWICVTATASTPIGTNCCFKVNFVCASGPAEIVVCASTCDCNPKPSQPVPSVPDWTTIPDPGPNPNPTVRFHVRWTNPDPSVATDPVQGNMMSQKFGVFAPDFGQIGSFNVPPIQPSSFFDVFFDVPLSQLPPPPQKMRPSSLALMGPENNGGCPADNHWDGNVDLHWTSPKMPGQVNKHYGTIQVCPGSGNSYIHVLTFCAGTANWVVGGLCSGFNATLVNEDFSPAPNPVPAGWTGFICISANTTVSYGTVCCFQVTFLCNGGQGVIDMCATACNCAKVNSVNLTPTGTFAIRAAIPNPTPGTTTFSYELPKAGRVKFEIFDATGRRVRKVMDDAVSGGMHTVNWDGRGENGRVLVPGTYLAKLGWQGQSTTMKVLLLH